MLVSSLSFCQRTCREQMKWNLAVLWCLLVMGYLFHHMSSNVYLLNNHMIRSYLISYVHSYYMFNVRSFMIGAGPAKAAAAPIQADLVKGTRLRLSSCAKVPADGSNWTHQVYQQHPTTSCRPYWTYIHKIYTRRQHIPMSMDSYLLNRFR